MGDILHAMPAVSTMRRLHPDWHIGWAIEPIWVPLLRADSASDSGHAGSPAMPLVDRIHSVPTRTWKQRPFAAQTLNEVKALRREFLAERYDLCVDMQSAIRSAVIGRISGAPELAGPSVPHEKPANWLYGKSIPTPAVHVVDQGFELLSAAIGDSLDYSEVLLPVDDSAECWRDSLLARTMGSNGHYAIIAPSAGWGAKQWPAERYGAVAIELARAGYAPLINATSSDDPLANAVVQASEGTATVVPCTVSELISLTRQASLVIAGDTGPLHLAAALERPVVALFGPTDPARNGPYGTRSRVLRHPSSRRDHSRHPDTEEGLLQITTDEVNAAALELLATEHDKVIL
ncbi:MAG TPA: glycosyltransferase family 9 protein [Edaphobacter sp.]